MDFQELKNALIGWNQIRNTQQGFDLLTSGDIMKFDHQSYSTLGMTDESEYIHLYIGEKKDSQDNPVITFFMIAEEYDKKEIVEDHIHNVVTLNYLIAPYFNDINDSSDLRMLFDPQSFHEAQSVSIEREEAWRRFLKWFVFRLDWFKKNQVKNEVVRAFKIPKLTLEKIVFIQNEPINDALIFFGLDNSKTEDNTFYIDVMLSSVSSKRFYLPLDYGNLTRPCPPFNCDEFGLLHTL